CPLHKIQMQFRAAPLRKTQVDPRRVFHIHVQAAEVLRPTSHFRGAPQQPANVIKFVRTVEDDAPAQFVARAVAFPIVLPRAPVGKVLPHLGAEPEHATDLPRIDEFLQDLQAGMKSQVVADLNVPVVAAGLGNQRLDSTGFMRKRFLDENVGLSLQGGQRLLHVVHRRSANQHDIRFEFPQCLAIVVEYFSAQFLTALLQRLGTGIAEPKIPHPKRLEVSCMPAANGTATDYQSPISYAVGNAGHKTYLDSLENPSLVDSRWTLVKPTIPSRTTNDQRLTTIMAHNFTQRMNYVLHILSRHGMEHGQADQPLISVFGHGIAFFGIGLKALAIIRMLMDRNVVHIHADILR